MSSNDQKTKYDEGPFQRLFGSNAIAKVLDFLIVHENYDYSINEIAEYTGAHRRTVARVIPTLEYYSIVRNERKIDRANMYKLNPESNLSSLLGKLSYRIAEHDIDVIMEQEKSTPSAITEKLRILNNSD